jgi:hypothetical protein
MSESVQALRAQVRLARGRRAYAGEKAEELGYDDPVMGHGWDLRYAPGSRPQWILCGLARVWKPSGCSPLWQVDLANGEKWRVTTASFGRELAESRL